MAVTRRHLLQAVAVAPLGWAASRAVAASPVAAPAGTAAVLAAAWQCDAGHRVGWLALRPGHVVLELAALDVPTRAHHVGIDGAGRLLAVARRPGDWMLRWAGPGSAPQWQWIDAGRAFNGHALTSADGQRVFTTETDLDSGAGLVGVRDAVTLGKLGEWPTAGTDPHQLLLDAHSANGLYVANGGLATRPETGRAKHDLARMDSSLVRLDSHRGELTGQWRLADPRLSLRHLAWQGAAAERQLGIALQAEHDGADERAAAPVLARFDGRQLHVAHAPMPLAGYGGDIVGTGDGFVVSCPRAGGLARFDEHGAWQGFVPLPQACALACDARGAALAAGYPRGTQLFAGATDGAATVEFGSRRLDNHWSST